MNTLGTGMRNTLSSNLFNGISSQRQFKDGYSAKLWSLAPDAVPFLTLLEKYRRITVGDPDFQYIEDRPSWLTDIEDALHGSAAGTITSLSTSSNVGDTFTCIFATGTEQAEGQVWAVSDTDDPTKFILFYLKSVSTVTWTCRLLTKPGFTPALSDITTFTTCIYGEGSDIPDVGHEALTTKWGSVQVFKKSLFISNTLKNNKNLMYNDPAFQKKRRLERLKFEIDTALLDGTGRYSAVTDDPWGAPPGTNIVDNDATYISGGGAVRTSISLDQAARMSNAVNLTGSRVFEINAASATYIDSMVRNGEDWFKYVDGDLWGICGPSFLSEITALTMKTGQYTLQTGETELGIDVTRVKTPHGSVNFMVKKGMGKSSVKSKRAYLFDPNYLALAVYTELFEEDKPTTYSGKLTAWEGEMGLMVTNPEKISLIQFI